MSNLIKYKFSDLYEMGSGISTSKEQAGHGYPFASFSTVINNYFLPDTLTDLMDATEEQREVSSILEGDILITRTSETPDELAMSCVALKDYPNATFSGFVKRLRPKNKDLVYPKYMAFYLRGPYFRKLVNSNTVMTLRASFNEHIFKFMNIYLPSYETQKQIGDLLYKIEQKIKINNEINDNLQQLTRMIYEQYFLQYSFNNEELVFDSSINRNRPLSWKVCKAKDILNICLGGTPDTSIKEYWNGNINWLNSGEIANFPIVESELNITQLGVDNSSTKLMPKNTTLVSITGNIRATITAIDTCANQSVVGVYESDLLHASYIYPVICDLLQHFTKVSGGNCQKHINKGTIDNMNILIPPTNVLLEYYSKVESSYQNIMRSALENKILVSLRNELLPLLINGQVTID